MEEKKTSSHLETTRTRIAGKVRELRRNRGWTQSELAHRLNLSQARLSEIERGGGSFSAEQLLELLALFNVSVAEFLPPANREDELQNALIQLGASHLRIVPHVIVSGRYRDPGEAILAVLLQPRSSRLVTALGPVLLDHLERISLPALRARLAAVSRAARLGWLLENVRDALLELQPGSDRAWRRRSSRAITAINNELNSFSAETNNTAPDLLDATIRSTRSLEQVWATASILSRRWNIVTELRTDDFKKPLEKHASH